jgi:hypothetical protein
LVIVQIDRDTAEIAIEIDVVLAVREGETGEDNEGQFI